MFSSVWKRKWMKSRINVQENPEDKEQMCEEDAQQQ